MSLKMPIVLRIRGTVKLQNCTADYCTIMSRCRTSPAMVNVIACSEYCSKYFYRHAWAINSVPVPRYW